MVNKKVKKFLDFVYEVYASMRAHEITLVYEGEITHQITKAFTSLAELDMAKEEEDGSIQKKVFHVMVECLQNISKHADSPQSDDFLYAGRGIFMVSRGDDCYHVISGNLVDVSKKEKLSEQLDHINSLDKDALKELYKTQMKEGRLSDKGGAGLGFIDIVRKTGNPLEYHFMPIDEKTQFFILTSTINRKAS